MQINSFLKHFLISLFIYIFLVLAIFCYLNYLGIHSIFNEKSLLKFDAALYQDIKNQCYHQYWLCAFFPAFPFIWKFLSIGIYGISIFNALVFIFSSSLLAQHYKLKWQFQLFFQSIPSLIFMFIPYTEAIFFLSSVLVILGLDKKNNWLLLFGLLLCSLSRPTTFVFIPVIIISYFISILSFKELLQKIIWPTIVLVLGLFVTILIHYNYTHTWLVFFAAQKLWNNYLHFPSLPLRSWGGDAINRYDGSVIFIMLVLLTFIFKTTKNRIQGIVDSRNDLIFSSLYIIATTILILAYRDGCLYSLNRFIYATPFVVVVFYHFFETYIFSWKDVWLVFILSEIVWVLFGSYNHIHNFLLFTCVSVYFMLLVFVKNKSRIISIASLIILILLNSYGFIKLASRFLIGGWIG